LSERYRCDTNKLLQHVSSIACCFVLLCGSTALAQQGSAGRPAPSVIVAAVAEREIDPPVENIGRVEALEAIDLRARVPGFVEKIGFAPGAFVKKGDVLFIIEPARYEAAVAAAKAQLARAEASRQQALITRDRNADLVSRSATARSALDDAQAALNVAEADVAGAQASLSKADLDLSYTRIAAPISGRIGQPLFTTGNLVGTDSGPIARLVQVDPIRVVFSVPEGDVVTYRQTQSLQKSPRRLTLTLPNGAAYDQEGKIEFVGPEIDPRTGTATVGVIFPNPDGVLMPGQFVKLAVGSQQVATGPAVAQSAVLQDRDGRFVYVLTSDNKVQQRRIETGAKLGDFWAVSSGLKAGEKIVIQGTQRLTDGIAVQPVEQQP
jgi:membrane fusion protein (multidrug efflux system)